MSDDDRLEWYKAALMTIGDLPADLLAQACVAARKVCDHPSKIVPYICRDDDPATDKSWLVELKWRKTKLMNARNRLENLGAKRISKKSFELPDDERREVATGIAALVKELEGKVKIRF